MKRTLLLFALGIALGAAARWATSPIAPTASPHAPDAWLP